MRQGGKRLVPGLLAAERRAHNDSRPSGGTESSSSAGSPAAVSAKTCFLSADRLITDVRIVDYGIRGMHLAYDLLDGYSVLVLVDAVPGDGSPGDISVLEVRESDLDGDLSSGEIDAHGMEPVSVLASLGKLGGTLPRTYVVDCRPASLEEDIGLSEPVAAAVPTAVIPGRVVEVARLRNYTQRHLKIVNETNLHSGPSALLDAGAAHP
jgi:hydrogenase maturation protease